MSRVRYGPGVVLAREPAHEIVVALRAAARRTFITRPCILRGALLGSLSVRTVRTVCAVRRLCTSLAPGANLARRRLVPRPSACHLAGYPELFSGCQISE